jgi:hippurate hydrolase
MARMPHLAVDPVVVAAQIIAAAQSIVVAQRAAAGIRGASACAASQAGNLGAMSVIPDEARIVGTVRTFDPAVQDLVEQRLRALVESIATAFGATASLDYERIYPATVNTEAEAAFGLQVARELVGSEGVVPDLDPSMGAEDFAFMLQVRPGAYFRIGQAGGPSGCFLHNPRYDFNDEILPLGAALFARLAERSMPLTQGDKRCSGFDPTLRSERPVLAHGPLPPRSPSRSPQARWRWPARWPPGPSRSPTRATPCRWTRTR